MPALSSCCFLAFDVGDFGSVAFERMEVSAGAVVGEVGVAPEPEAVGFRGMAAWSVGRGRPSVGEGGCGVNAV
jgi:hypothetical protein